MGQTYYEILGVAENATTAEIDAAFRAKARDVHPDTVPAENAYLRKVAAEAFKDLSEAKAVLLDPDRRRKYDAGLVYTRSTSSHGSVSSSSTGAPSPRSSARSRSSSRSRSGWSRTQAASGAPQRARNVPPRFPDIKNLNGFLFMMLGVATIFFLVVLVWSGRMPPLWLAAITACLGILSFLNGMRPNASKISGGRTALIVSTVLLSGILVTLWLASPSYLDIAILAHRADKAAARLYKSQAPPRPSASQVSADGPSVAVVDQGGEGAALPTKIWTNLKDGQNYRTRENGDALFLDAIENGAKGVGEITKCEFHRAAGGAPTWVGICSEPALQGEVPRKSMATLSQFSDTRLEGSTADIPVFVMTPVDSVQVGVAAPLATGQVAPKVGPPAEGETIAEPDLSELSKGDKEAIEATCASDKVAQGVEKYNECLRRQVEELKKAPKPRGLSKLNSMDRDTVEFACTTAKLMQGPAAYNQCLVKQMEILKKQRP
jgi:DnaJ domain